MIVNFTFIEYVYITHDGSMVLLYMVCHGSHQYTLFMLAFFYQHHGSVMGSMSICSIFVGDCCEECGAPRHETREPVPWLRAPRNGPRSDGMFFFFFLWGKWGKLVGGLEHVVCPFSWEVGKNNPN